MDTSYTRSSFSVRACLLGALLCTAWLLSTDAAAAQTEPAGGGVRPTLYPIEQYLAAPPGPLGRNVSIRADQMSLVEVLREIGRQAGLELVFSTDLALAAPPISLTLHSVTAAEAIHTALRVTGLKGLLTPDWKVLIVSEAGLDQEQPPSHRNSSRAMQGQTVRGRVVDRDSRAPLPGANVAVLDTDPLIGTMTDAGGQYVLRHVPLGRHEVQVSFIGYEPVIVPEVLVTSGKEVVLDVELKEQVLVGAEVVVVPEVQKDRPLNDLALVSARSFSVEETRRYAGGVDDPARMAAAFAGVTASVGLQDNALAVRGNAPKGVLWRLEGVEIPNPNHFGGLSVAGGGGLTLFSSQLLADSDFFTGAFPAEYGNALAGVFDMYFRSGNPMQREHAVQVGLLGIDLASEGPLAQGKPFSYLFNYRYSTIALLLPLLPTEDVAKYQDLAFKLDFPTRKLGRFEVWGLGGLDGQTMAENRDSTQWEYDLWDRVNFDLKLGVGAAGVTHNLVLRRRSYLRSTLALTASHTSWDHRRLNDDLALQDDLFIRDTSGRLILSSYLNHKFGTRHVNRTGFTLQRLFYDFDLQAAPDNLPPLTPVAGGQGSSMLAQLYTQSRFDLSAGLALNVGAHAQYFDLTGRYTVEPRTSLRWQFSSDQAVSLGYGLHSQIEDLRLYFVRQPTPAGLRTPNRRLDFAKAHHGVLGYDRRLGEASRLKVEGYFQYLFDVPVIPDSSYSLVNFEQDWEFNHALVSEGAGTNYGVELTLERFLKDGYYYLMTGSLFDSRYRGGDGLWRDTRFNRTYAANALFGKEFTLGNNLLGVNGRLVFVGGKRHSPVDVAASLRRQEVVYDERRAFQEQDPGTFLLEMSLTYRRNRRRHAEVWALQVKNVLAAKDVYLDYNYRTDAVEEIKEGYPVPVLSYKIEF